MISLVVTCTLGKVSDLRTGGGLIDKPVNLTVNMVDHLETQLHQGSDLANTLRFSKSLHLTGVDEILMMIL